MPKMKHDGYWADRFRRLEQGLYEAGLNYSNELKKQYGIALDNADKELAAWYQRFADAEGISYTQAKKKLDKRELSAFKMSVDDYIEKGKTLKYSDAWAKELERASTRVHVDRLEALKIQLSQTVETLYTTEEKGLKKVLKGIYEGGFYQTGFEIQKGTSVGFDLSRMDQNRLDKLLVKPWAADGINFSDRIWRDKKKLMQELPTILTQGMIRGESYETMAKALAKRMGVAESRAANLVATESAFFASAGQRDCFNDLDVQRFEIVATLDKKTSEICREMDGKYFPMSDFAPGITAPPFHCRCRSTTCPYFDDEFEYGAKRAARGDDGKTYYVPADMTYPQWYETFVNGGDKAGLTPLNLQLFAELKANSEESGIINTLPKTKEAIIPEAKFINYALDPERQPDKARAFKSALGYTKENYEYLIKNIRENLDKFEAKQKGDKGWGMTYEVIMKLKGPNGKQANVLTAWVDDKNNGEMRLTTVHVD